VNRTIRRPSLSSHCLAFALVAAFAWAAPPAAAMKPVERPPALQAFASEAELKAFLEELKKKLAPQGSRVAGGLKYDAQPVTATAPPVVPSPAAPPAPAAAPAKIAEQSVGTDKSKDESVTNVQTAGVDEGGIVKVHGDHLVILRRGRLFTVRIGQEGKTADLKPVSAVDAFGPGIEPGGAWYDEMLMHGNTIVVIGYSYHRGGTEIGLFDIDRNGALAYRSTYHLRSNDYYSSRNYASRLVGDKLIFYTPLYLNLWGDPYAGFPAMRKWQGKADRADFRNIAPATRIYRSDDNLEPHGLALHTVTVCSLAAREMDCEATAVLGPQGRVFYVAQNAVYVWTTDHRREARAAHAPQSAVFRIPLDGAEPRSLKASGAPVDQFSFLESADGHLNVLVRANAKGEAMWSSETSAGDTALLRVRVDSFGNGRQSAPASSYTPLPNATGYTLQNRFIGNYLLYGSGASWGAPKAPGRNTLHTVRWAQPDTVQTLSLPHGVDRIEAMGRHAVIVGSAGKDLIFSSVRLEGEVRSVSRYTRENAAQGETRSHGFFYKQDAQESGVVGLPIVGGGRPGHRQLREGSAAVLYLRNEALKLAELGSLDASADAQRGDNCRASCVDWYGNARPLFLRGRVFALMGYEIVEGRIADGRIGEIRRTQFTPR
jgi:hypothetical protein